MVGTLAMATAKPCRNKRLRQVLFLTVVVLLVLSILRVIIGYGKSLQVLDDPPTRSRSHEYCSRVHLPYQSQIAEDLQPFQSTGISREMLTKLYEAHAKRYGVKAGNFFHIRNNTFHLSFRTEQEEKDYLANFNAQCDSSDCSLFHRLCGMMATLMLYSCFVQLPDLDGFMHRGDGMPSFDNHEHLPTFGFQKRINETGILIPYMEHLLHNLSKFSHDAQRYAWPSKQDTLFWRGASTGGVYNRDNWRNFPRSRLVQKCQNNTQLNCDAAFYFLPQTTPDAKQEMMTELGTKPPKPLLEQMQYKYIISLDGNGACAGRFEKLVSGSSLVLKQESPSFEFYYNAFKPYQHYVPVHFNMDNLEEQIQWARTHEQDVKRIVEAMQNVSKSIHQENVACYVRDLFREYSKLYKDPLDPIEKLPRVHQIMPDICIGDGGSDFQKHAPTPFILVHHPMSWPSSTCLL